MHVSLQQAGTLASSSLEDAWHLLLSSFKNFLTIIKGQNLGYVIHTHDNVNHSPMRKYGTSSYLPDSIIIVFGSFISPCCLFEMAVSLPSLGILGVQLGGRHLAEQLSNFVPVKTTSYASFQLIR